MAKKFRVAIIGRTGHGNYGHFMDELWLQVPNAEIVAVADDDKVGLAKAVARVKSPAGFVDYREMLDKTKPDVACLGLRWVDKHHEMVLACAERGIHVFMEKPMCRTLVEADEMVAACERTHVKFAMAHQTRYSPKIPVIKQMLADGMIGDVLEYRGRGKEDKRGGGEDLWVLGSHIMDLLLIFGGKPEWCFATVSQSGHPITKADVYEGKEGIGPLAGDALQAVYGMPGGRPAYFSSVRDAGPKKDPFRFGLQILGTKGVLNIQSGYLPAVQYLDDPTWHLSPSGKQWQPVSSAGLNKPEPLEDGGLLAGNLLAAKDLLAAIEEDRQPQCSVYESRASTEMIVAVFESQRQGKPVKLPLVERRNPLTLL